MVSSTQLVKLGFHLLPLLPLWLSQFFLYVCMFLVFFVVVIWFCFYHPSGVLSVCSFVCLFVLNCCCCLFLFLLFVLGFFASLFFICSFFFLCFFFYCQAVWLAGSWFPSWGVGPESLGCERQVQDAGTPENSWSLRILNSKSSHEGLHLNSKTWLYPIDRMLQC